MVSLFAHEFTPAPLSLCDGQDFDLLNQQQKSEIVKFFEKEFPSCFSTSHPRCDNERWALIIDGGPLLEIKPSKINGNVFDYAKQLLITQIIPLFVTYDRIDIVFDSDRSKNAKSFIKRHGQSDSRADQYDLKPTDVLDCSNFHRFVHSHRAKLAKIVRLCWSQDELIDLLPMNKCFIVAGPQDESIKLLNKNQSGAVSRCEIIETLESNHVEADTRLFLHVYDVQTDDEHGKYSGIVVQSIDTDVFILSIAHVRLIMLSQCFIKRNVSSNKTCKFIDVKEIWRSLQKHWNLTEPNILLTIHALSGCDTTSFTRNISKTNYLLTYLSDPDQYADLVTFGDCATIFTEPIMAAERLLVSCYENSKRSKSSLTKTPFSSRTTTATSSNKSLNWLRQDMAIKHYKSQTGTICTKLPPTSDAFEQHCRRVWKQVFEWKKAFEPYDLMRLYDVNDYGFERTNSTDLSIKWSTIPAEPSGKSLVKCVKCSSGCRHCKCAKSGVPCTPQCGCSDSVCTNRTKDLVIPSLQPMHLYLSRS